MTSVLDTLIPEAFPRASSDPRVLTSPLAFLGVTVAVLAIAYRVLPPRRPSVGDVAVPAIVAGIAVSLLTQVFTFLAPSTGRPTAFVGSLAAAFVALAWLSFSSRRSCWAPRGSRSRMSSRTVSLPLTVESETATAAPPAAVESTPDDVREDADLQR